MLYISSYVDQNITIMKNRRLIAIILVVAIILSIPLVAMQFTTEVDWGPLDFIVMGLLLLATGLSCELVLRRIKSAGGRIAICGAILLALLLIWAELAVGIFGSPFSGS